MYRLACQRYQGCVVSSALGPRLRTADAEGGAQGELGAERNG
jgi:hypothetical protein